MKPLLTLLSLIVSTAATAQAVSVNFTGASDFSNNFRLAPSGSGNQISQSGSLLNVTGNNTGTPALIYVYDTTPGDSSAGTQSSFAVGIGQTITASFDIGNISATGAGSSLGFYFASPSNEAGAVNFMALLNIDGSGTSERARFGRGATLSATNPNGTLGAGTPEYGDGGMSLLDSAFRTVTASYAVNSASSVTLSLQSGSFSSTATYSSITALTNVVVGFRVSPTAAVPLTSFQLDNFNVTAPIPEPSSFAALAGLAMLGISATRRRARR
jgi:hypothetical protein